MPSLNVPQGQFLRLDKKFKALVCGFGTGKTWAGCADLCKFAWEWPGVNAGYFAPTSRHGSADDLRYFIDECHRVADDVGDVAALVVVPGGVVDDLVQLGPGGHAVEQGDGHGAPGDDQRVGDVMAAGRVGGVGEGEHAQVHEQAAAVVAIRIDPTAQGDRLANVNVAELAAGVGTVSVHGGHPLL